MNRILFLIAGMSLVITAAAQVPKDKADIEKLCGCYDVEFKYAETFSPDPKYKYHDRDEISDATELILPIEISDKRVVIQHLLVVSEAMVIKHWRETWTYEDPVVWKYQGNQVWTKEQLKPEAVKGKWTQSVWEVSDAPRYQGASEWLTTDGKTFWENTADAPLPRREYTVRNDYNIMRRTNRIILTDSGWVHDQYNQKIIRAGGVDKLLVEEKGLNTYYRTDMKYCAAAKNYWEKNKGYWEKVRNAWADYMGTHSRVEMKNKVDGKALYDYLFDLAGDYASGKVKADAVDAAIRADIEKFMGHEEQPVVQK